LICQRAQLDSEPLPTHAPTILIRTLLLQCYAEARDLLLRPEMYKHLIKFLLDLQILTARYDMKANYPATRTARDIIDESDERAKPDKLYPGIIKDANRCYNAVKKQRERLSREAKRLLPFLPPKERIRYAAGTRLAHAYAEQLRDEPKKSRLANNTKANHQSVKSRKK
jgi:hypothetical protein